MKGDFDFYLNKTEEFRIFKSIGPIKNISTLFNIADLILIWRDSTHQIFCTHQIIRQENAKSKFAHSNDFVPSTIRR